MSGGIRSRPLMQIAIARMRSRRNFALGQATSRAGRECSFTLIVVDMLYVQHIYMRDGFVTIKNASGSTSPTRVGWVAQGGEACGGERQRHDQSGGAALDQAGHRGSPVTINTLIAHLRDQLALLGTDGERLAVFERVTRGYCRRCGRKMEPHIRHWCACRMGF